MDTSDPLFVLRKACEELDRRGVTHVSELKDKKSHKQIKLEDQDYVEGYPTPYGSPAPFLEDETKEKKSQLGRKDTSSLERQKGV